MWPASRPGNSVHGDQHQLAPPSVSRLYAEFEGAWRERLGTRTLEEWVLEAGRGNG